MEVFIGVDGGGTKTNLIAINKENEEIAKVITKSTNKNAVGIQQAQENLSTALEALLSQIKEKIQNPIVKSIWLGISGLDKQLVESWIAPVLQKLSNYEEIKICASTDVEIALAAGTNGQLKGVVVISGTGTIAFAHLPSHDFVRSAGWGGLFGDVGCGYWIGTKILRSIALEIDGMGEPTILRQLLADSIGTSDIKTWAYTDQSWNRIAAIAPVLFDAVKADDNVAKKILQKAVDGLFLSVKNVIQRQKFEKNETYPIIFSGGLLSESCLISQKLKEKLEEEFPNFNVVHPTLSAEFAAALLAKNSLSL